MNPHIGIPSSLYKPLAPKDVRKIAEAAFKVLAAYPEIKEL